MLQAQVMTADNLDVRLLSFRSRRNEAPLALATALLDAGRPSDALEVSQAGLSDDEQDCGLLVLEGRAWFGLGDLLQAQAALLRAVKTHPREKEPYRWLAQVLMKRGEPTRAVHVYDRVLALDPGDRALQQARSRAERLARIATEAGASEAPPGSPFDGLGASLAPAVQVLPPDYGEQPATAQVSESEPAVLGHRPGGLDPIRSTQPYGGLRALISDPPKPATKPEEEGAEESEDEPTQSFELSSEVARLLDMGAARPTLEVTPRVRPALEVLPEPTEPFTLERRRDEEVTRQDVPNVEVHDTRYAPSESDLEAERTDVAEEPEEVLRVLEQQGVFEAGALAGASEPWATGRDAPQTGHRVGKGLAVGWALALVAAGGGYYGWTRFLEMRRANARSMVAQAIEDARDGDHERLLAAERKLVQARELDPKSDKAVEALLFVHAVRAIEDAAGDIGYLRVTTARAERSKASKALVLAAKALLCAYDRDAARAKTLAESALKADRQDARVLYLVGRLHQRLGVGDAEALLSQASQRDPELSLAWLGQAEVARQQGRDDEARQWVEQALGADRKQLRAELWSVVLATDSTTARDQLGRLDALAARIGRGSASDKLLAQLARAGALIAAGDVAAAGAVVRGNLDVEVQDPELLSLLADRAALTGEHDLAYRAANAAVLAAPGNRRYRDALANVLLKRGDGRAVLAALDGLTDKGPWMLIMRARAALLTGSREAAEEAKRTLSAHRQTEAGKEDVDAAALLVRLDLRLGANPESLMAAARALARKADDSPLAQVALGETLLSAGQAEDAVQVLERALGLGAGDPDILCLLGRSQRRLGQVAEARRSFERALAAAPSHTQAREALGSLLLDVGDFAAAESVFVELQRSNGGTAAAVGTARAKLGRGDTSGAKQLVAGLPAAELSTPAVQAVSAQIALAEHRPGEAIKLLEPLVAEDSEQRSADLLVLYGQALYAANDVDEAAGAYDAALELDESHPDALIGRAMAALRAEKLPQAHELLDAAEEALATRVRPAVVHGTLKLTRGKARMLQKKYEAAKPDLATATQVPGIAAEAFFWFGETLAKTKSPGAAEQYTKYLELEPAGEFAARAKKALAPR